MERSYARKLSRGDYSRQEKKGLSPRNEEQNLVGKTLAKLTNMEESKTSKGDCNMLAGVKAVKVMPGDIYEPF